MTTFLMNTDPINIIIVDNSTENLHRLKGYLDALNCKIYMVKSSDAVLDMLEKIETSLLLINLSVLGIDVLASANIPIIFIGDYSLDQSSLIKWSGLETVDFLTIPIDPLILKCRVRVFLNLYLQKRLLRKQTELFELNRKELLKLKETNCKLESLSTIDGLTGIPNRRHFDESIRKLWKNALREQQPISLVMIDIDHFKQYNDTYGHLQGDDCLVLVAKSLALSVHRPGDFLARYGGEEFIVVLPNSDKEGAFHVAERMRKCIERLAIQHHSSDTSDCVTISIGVAEITPEASDSITDFINDADNALYLAKQLGRNQVHVGNLSRLRANKSSLQKKLMYMSFRETIAGLLISKG